MPARATWAIDVGWTPGQRLVQAEIEGEPLTGQVEKRTGGLALTTRGAKFDARVLTPASHCSPTS
jgi:propionyl-CoA carboxylase alpha chain